MNLGLLAATYARLLGSSEEHVQRLWKMIAFLGRFGHQPANVCLDMTMLDLQSLAHQVGELLREESESMKRGASDD